jgi:hypothetical protein
MAKRSTNLPEKMHGKRVSFDAATWTALDLYARDSMKSFQELADEAFADLLKKHGRPTDLKDALRRSSRELGANDNRDAEPNGAPPGKRKKSRS